MSDDLGDVVEATNESPAASPELPIAPERPSRLMGIIRLLATAFVLGVVGAIAIFGYVQGRQEAAVEAERDQPIKPPLRVKLQPRGEPIVTFDAAAQKIIDLKMMTPTPFQYIEQANAYGVVLDLANLTTLDANYVAAVSQLTTAKAQLAASQPAFERAESLYARNFDTLAQKQAAEASVLTDKASVAAAESKVRTLAATAIQEWGPIIGRGVVSGAGIVDRLIGRKEFLLQVTVPLLS